MRNRTIIILLAFILVLANEKLFSQTDSAIIDFFSKGSLFETIFTDPTECQYSGSILVIGDSGSWKNEVYMPVSFALHKTIFRFRKRNYAIEIGAQAACFTQFNMKRTEGSVFLGSMLNTDFFGGLFVHFRKNSFAARMRFYHVSSHIADDYILRYGASARTPSTLDREQADFMFSLQRNSFRYYSGFGYVITPNAFRKRFLAQIGFIYVKKQSKTTYFRPIVGSDIKCFQQNDFRPNIKIVAGVEIGQSNSRPLRFAFEYYNGHLPYSTLEHRVIEWLGINLTIDPF